MSLLVRSLFVFTTVIVLSTGLLGFHFCFLYFCSWLIFMLGPDCSRRLMVFKLLQMSFCLLCSKYYTFPSRNHFDCVQYCHVLFLFLCIACWFISLYFKVCCDPSEYGYVICFIYVKHIESVLQHRNVLFKSLLLLAVNLWKCARVLLMRPCMQHI